ncbi:DUF4912 domain-containing protein [Falsibacillus pallidus]|uniref:DUF4912 domain-containing protein n=1 Tax=Falsibacillus pallidus TaxID=493781 RepID=A0A370GL03_9BACI|nr:DUF4912 domain-containing protein [Falsibacillus pallidus]RDI43959.1 hypothetical protein DFR59_10321 [Falsibacillus pallidus]
MIAEIKQLREQGLSFRKIAKELNMTVGKVQYSWVKYQKASESQKEENDSARKMRIGKVRSMSRIPASPGNYLHVLYSSGTRVLCYWHFDERVTGAVIDYYGREKVGTALVMRVYYDGVNSESIQEIMIPPNADHWFLSELTPGNTCYIELGLLIESISRFLPLLKSESISVLSNDAGTERNRLTAEPAWGSNVSTYSYYSGQMNQSGRNGGGSNES